MPSPDGGGGTPRWVRGSGGPRLGPRLAGCAGSCARLELLLLLTSCLALALAPAPAASQLHYSVPEELEHGAFVANIAEDLGLDVSKLSARRFRIVSRAGSKQHLEVNLENGILFVNEKIDREEVCEASGACLLHLQLVIESPLELYRVEVEVLDINDNAPSFPWQEYVLEVTESALPGARFPLESAQDPDVGTNSLRTYRLSPNGFFSLEVQTRSDGSKFAELVLERSLDREQQRSHRVLLTALDGGIPERSGTARVVVTVLDANDNVPVFDQSSYTVSLPEDAPKGTLVIRLNATDLDEGTNGEVEYSFSGHAPPRVRELFSVEPRSGQVRLKGQLDYERANLHELYVQAKDRGPSAVAVHCRVLVHLVDVNDNAPEVTLTSVSTPVLEDAPPGTVIAVISVLDRDSGDNGKVSCEIPPDVPFQLQSSFHNYYTLVTTDPLDREAVPEYNISITARDRGSPALATRKTLTVHVSDINDNAPRFLQPSYSVYVMENNAPGASICSVSALDPDCKQNSYLSYSIADGQIQGMPVATYVSINSDSGHMYALRSLDYEQIRNFQIQVLAQDAGFPPLSSNVTVHVFVLDQNDNAPVIVAPVPRNGSLAVEVVPRSADPGYLVGKVSAVDADAGQNSRLSYQIVQATDSSLFSVALYTGEIRTIRAFLEKDAPRHRLLVQVRDNGQPPLSASVSLLLSVVDSVPEVLSDFSEFPLGPESASSTLTLYLIVSLGSVSFTFLVAIVILTAVKCHKDRLTLQDYGCSLPPCGGGGGGGSCCSCDPSGPPTDIFKNSNHIHNSQVPSGNKGATNCGEGAAVGGPPGYCYKVCLTPESAKSDFMFLKPYSPAAPRNNEKVPDNLPPAQGKTPRLANNSLQPSSQVKQPNTDWLPSKQSTLKSSQSLEDVGGVRRGIQKEHDRLRTLVTPVSELQKAPGASNSIWTPRYAPVYSQHMSPLDYQHNVYIPGTPTMPANKDGPLFLDQEAKNSFSTFGKRKKMTTYCDIHDNMVINNNLK
ncbi:protocadherin-10-like [Podarcis raffonei]|uniref:Protocadherin-10-like n=2 Tax=Podarcis TaxID=42163 RepID=A0A670ILC0_PODMU|nr:protocadherin-10-like [Podarcis muralis]XP_053253404.1 protocadherin-10-like [Podarcis raffonei]CAI5780402.1 protocadherinprotocadherin-10-like [Podarcis lilfordi]